VTTPNAAMSQDGQQSEIPVTGQRNDLEIGIGSRALSANSASL
jgi:hypothetical protein